MAYWFLAGGLLLLILGSEGTLRGGAGLARALGFSPLVIGLLIAVAVSTPELSFSLRAGVMKAPGLALGDVIGGDVFVLLFVLGLGALIRPMVTPPKVVLRDGGALFLASLVLSFFAANGSLSRREGLLLLGLFAVYVAMVLITDWRRAPEHSIVQARALARMQSDQASPFNNLLFLVFGVIGLVLGSHFAVSGGAALARDWTVEPAFVGLTVVAFGTSLPKLVATVMAAARGQNSLAVGILLGTNVFDLLGVLGLTAAIAPLAVPPMLGAVDLYVLTGASAVLLPLLAMRWRVSRHRGALLLVAYVCYLGFVLWRQGLLPFTVPGVG